MSYPLQPTYISGLERIQPVSSVLGTLKHILVGCKTSLTQGRYTWRHNQVLKGLAVTLESKRVTVNAMPLEAQTTFHQLTSFIREGEKRSTNRSSPDLCPLNAAQDWEMRVDLSQRLTFPPENAAINLRPDLVLWSKSCRHVFIVELTVPWEEAIDEASHLYLYSAFNNTNCNKALHNIKIGKLCQ